MKARKSFRVRVVYHPTPGVGPLGRGGGGPGRNSNPAPASDLGLTRPTFPEFIILSATACLRRCNEVSGGRRK